MKMTPEKEFLLQNPHRMLEQDNFLALWKPGFQYPIGEDMRHRLVRLKETGASFGMETFVVAEDLKLILDDVFFVTVLQKNNVTRVTPVMLDKALITQGDVATKLDNGWLEIPKFYAQAMKLDFVEN